MISDLGITLHMMSGKIYSVKRKILRSKTPITIKMPNGEEHIIPLPPKKFSTGRLGYYSQIPSFIYNDDIYGGQIQVWKKGKEIESEKVEN